MFLKKSTLISIVKKWRVMADVDERLIRKITWFYGVRTGSAAEPKSGVTFWTSDDNVHVAGFNNYYNLLHLSGPERGVPVEVDYPIKISYNINSTKLIVTERFGVKLSKSGKLTTWGLELSPDQYEKLDEIRLEFTSGLSDDTYDDVFCGGYSIICVKNNQIWIKGWLDPDGTGFVYDYAQLSIKAGLVMKSISCGAYHVAMVDQHGQVWTFGFGLTGQLGYHWSAGDGYDNPLRVALPNPCIKVECGSYSTLFLLDNGDVYASGRNSEFDNLCVGLTDNVFTPVRVQFDEPIADIAASYLEQSGDWPSRFGAVSRDHKKYYLWGENHPEQTPTWKKDIDNLFDLFLDFNTPQSLGKLDHEEPYSSESTPTPVGIEPLPATILDKWSFLQAMPDYLRTRLRAFTVFGTSSNNQLLGAFVTTVEDEVYGIGLQDNYKSLGITGKEHRGNFYTYPNEIRVLGSKKIIQIALNLVNGVALTRNGYVYIWEYGLGPEIMDAMQDNQIVNLSAGAKFFLFLDIDANVFFVGTMSSEYPAEDNKAIVLPAGGKAVQIASGEWHGAILANNSTVYTFGHGVYSQLGYSWSSSNSPYEPRKVPLPGPCKKIACGVCSTLFVMESGDLYACGINKYADVLGVGHGDTVVVPEKVKLDEAVVDIAISTRNASFGARVSSFAVQTASGKIYTWGRDLYSPKLLEGATSIVEAFANQELPCSLSMVPLAPPQGTNPNLPDGADDDMYEISEGELFKFKVGGIPYNDYGDPLFTDVILKLADGTVAAHSYYLFPKSKFFRDVYSKTEGKTEGAEKNVIDVTQYNPNAVRALLTYV